MIVSLRNIITKRNYGILYVCKMYNNQSDVIHDLQKEVILHDPLDGFDELVGERDNMAQVSLADYEKVFQLGLSE